MKFRYKVLTVNIILLSISLGIVGFLMIRKNYNLAHNAVLKSAIEENNLVQANIEYEILSRLNSGDKYKIKAELGEIGKKIVKAIMSSDTSFYIRYNEDYVYTSDANYKAIPENLFSIDIEGRKNYLIQKEDGAYYCYVTAFGSVDGKAINIISKKNVDEIMVMLKSEIAFFRVLMVVVIIACAIAMYIISVLLTRPLEKLDKTAKVIGSGNYKVRSDVKSSDEIGDLAGTFNEMAESIDNHVVELNDMIHRREQFVADFTHEIKTPMTSIIGYSDTLRSVELSKEEQMMAINYIFSEGKRLEALSKKLFELLYLRQNDIEVEKLHTTDILTEVIRITQPMLNSKDIVLSHEVQPAIFEGNKELILTVFINLIDNARKASDKGSEIKFVGELNEDTYTFKVIDKGIGMSEESVKKMCDEFYMADKSRSRKEGGAGLGMSLVGVILEHHKAELSVESELGSGTTISITFSNASPEAEEEEWLEGEVQYE